MMFKRSVESRSHAARQSFLLGERSLRAYFAGGNVRFLKDAEVNFGALRPGDPLFGNARFYLGVAKTQLRETKQSIEIFEDLRKSADASFRHQISLQLAYAHIKNYTEEDYLAAEKELDQLTKTANDLNDADLLLQTKSIQAFLYSVMAGRSKKEELRPKYAARALELGKYILDNVDEDAESGLALRFEALNALGITWMRLGESAEEKDRAARWQQAQRYYEQALMIIPNSVRVLQNMAQLRLSQVKFSSPNERAVLLEQAKQYCELSLEVSDQDQFPFYLLAQIAIQLGDISGAWTNIYTGRSRSGAVKDKDWARVEDAARTADSKETRSEHLY
jgi:hypothetical protein